MRRSDLVAERLRGARPLVLSSPPPFARVAALIEQDQVEAGRQDGRGTGRNAQIEAGSGTGRNTQIDPGPGARRGAVRAVQPASSARWTRRFGLLVVLGALTLAGCAWGASQLLSGSPVTPAFAWVEPKPTVGLGAPLPASLRVLGLRAADPGGGPPWGIRVIRTTRGQACLQAGRVVDGKVGALGIGYAFHGDGRFHPFLPEDALGLQCFQTDGQGHAYRALGAITVSADGLSLAENTFERVHCDLPSQHNWGIRCPRADLRLLAYGVLGSDAANLSVSFNGHTFNVKPYGPEGAYILVFAAPKGTNVGGYFGAQAPIAPTLTVHFRDGSSCAVPDASDTDLCKPQGIDFSRGPALTVAKLVTPVHVAYARHVVGGQAPFVLTGTHSAAAAPKSGSGPGLVVSFTARVGTPVPLSAYAVEIHRSVVPGCFGGEALVSQEPVHTISPGHTVRIVVPLQPACHGHYSGRVSYFALDSGLEAGGEERLISRISSRMMGLSGDRAKGEQELTVGHFDVEVRGAGPDSSRGSRFDRAASR